jgi:hypothetical protein
MKELPAGLDYSSRDDLFSTESRTKGSKRHRTVEPETHTAEPRPDGIPL